jgi:hypothetical protein
MNRMRYVEIIMLFSSSSILGCGEEILNGKDDGGQNADDGSFNYTREMELFLESDDNTCEAVIGPYGDDVPGGMIANCFIPPSWPTKIKSARFFVGQYYGIPTTEFGVRVFRETGGRPGTEIIFAAVKGSASAGNTWASVDLEPAEIVIDSGNFCVAMEWLTCWGPILDEPESQILCADNDSPLGRTWIRLISAGTWESIATLSYTDVNAMIRVRVKY